MLLYLLFKTVHITTAVLSGGLFVTRLSLDAMGVPWRNTPLRFIPHINDTILLLAAAGLCIVTGWYPFVNGWLTAKVLLLCLYIILGKMALDVRRKPRARIGWSLLAVLALAAIFYHAIFKPY